MHGFYYCFYFLNIITNISEIVISHRYCAHSALTMFAFLLVPTKILQMVRVGVTEVRKELIGPQD